MGALPWAPGTPGSFFQNEREAGSSGRRSGGPPWPIRTALRATSITKNGLRIGDIAKQGGTRSARCTEGVCLGSQTGQPVRPTRC